MNAYASSSAVTLDDLPPTSLLQSWVHRPQAVAVCTVKDVYSLCTIEESNGNVTSTSRDVFLLGGFPCRFVEVVAWVAGVDHREASMTITIDDGDGEHVLQVIIRLSEVTTPEQEKAQAERRTTFRSAAQRKESRMNVSGLPRTAPLAKVYARPDVRVGDTVRIVGRVEEWQRRTETIRQISVDEASGTGSIVVVDPDVAYAHVLTVIHLHQTLYSQPFIMSTLPPSATATPAASPAKSNMSTLSSIGLSSELDAIDDEYGRDLPDPSKLSSSRLTESTFKLYLIDHMVCEASRTMRAATRCSTDPPLPSLETMFPEYRAATSKPAIRPPPMESYVFTPTSRDNADPVTPRPRGVFRSRAERERDRQRRQLAEDDPHFSDKDRTPRKQPSPVPTAPPPTLPRLEECPAVFTESSILEDERLRDLAERIVNQQARSEEKLRRRRAKEGAATERDRQVVAARRARGVPSGDYNLTPSERAPKMTRLVEWAIRQAATEGGIVHLRALDSKGRTAIAYIALPPELLGHLIIPLVIAERSRRVGVFRPRSDRGAPAPGIDVSWIISRLRQWGEDGRWERVGEWAVDQALAWLEKQGLVDLRL